MIPALTSATPARLMEEEGIGWLTAAPAQPGAATKNEVAIETLELKHEKLDAGAKGIIAVLIGL